jgi:hypothetical protein
MEITVLLLAGIGLMQFVNLIIIIALSRTNVKLVEWLSGSTEDNDEEARLKQARLEYWARQTGYDYGILKAMMDSRDSVNLDSQKPNYDGVLNYPKRQRDSLSEWSNG